MRNLNPDEWQPLCCTTPCIQLHNSPLRPDAHGRHFENCIWYSLEIEENEQDMEWWGSRAIYIWNWGLYFYGINCCAKTLKRVRSTSFVVQMTCIVVAEKLRGFKAFGCKWIYNEMLCWLSIMTVWILGTTIEHRMIVSILLRWASMEW